MTPVELREIAASMRASHGPEHQRHAMWEAIATSVEDAYCTLCHGGSAGWRAGCGHDDQYRRLVAVATAYRDADTSEPMTALDHTYCDGPGQHRCVDLA